LVEQWTENPRVGGSIPPLATTFYLLNRRLARVTSADGAVGLFELLVALPITDEVDEGGSQSAQQFVAFGLVNGERG
jgi:hypothetical protein